MNIDLSKVTPEQLAQYSYKYFFTKVLGFTWTKWHEECYELLQNNKRILAEVSRGHGKTVFFSIGYPIWLVYRGAPVDILLISYSEEQVKNNIMNKIDEIIMNNPHLKELRPSAKQQWGVQLKTFANGSTIRGESFGSSVRGAHPDYLNVDDPLKDKGGMAPDEQLSFFMRALMGTVKQNTQVVVDGTPMDHGDLLEQLENNKSFVFKRFPSENESRTEALFPELYSLDFLQSIEAERGSLFYAHEYLLQRIDPKTQVFKDQYRLLNNNDAFPEFRIVRTIVDPAISEKDTACDSAVITVGIDSKNHKWEIDTRLLNADNPNIILDAIIRVASIMHKQYYDYAIVIESELFQKVLAFDLRQKLLNKNLDIRVIEVVHHGLTGKHQRIIGLQSSWEARGIHLLPESPLIQQFRYYRPNIKGFKLDGLDAFSWIRSESVASPVTNSRLIDPGIPEDAWN